jgi:hypothetical protein
MHHSQEATGGATQTKQIKKKVTKLIETKIRMENPG